MKRNISIILLLAGWVLSLQAQTAVDLLQSAVKQQLQQWTVKGEFEKTSAYKARIQEKGEREFRKLCEVCFPKPTFAVTPVRYDADEEEYELQMRYTLQYPGKRFADQIKMTVPIDVDAARYLSQHASEIPVADCVWGLYNGVLAPQSFQMTINGVTYKAVSPATDLELTAASMVPDVADMQDVRYNMSESRRNHIERKGVLIEKVEALNDSIRRRETEKVQALKASPYFKQLPEHKKRDFTPVYEPKHFELTDDVADILRTYHMLRADDGGTSVEALIAPVKTYLRKTDIEKYTEAFLEAEPDSAVLIRTEWDEYSCHAEYAKIHQFVLAYQNGKLDKNKRDCREHLWTEYKRYYESKEAFNFDFNKGKGVVEERKRVFELFEVEKLKMQKYLNTDVANLADNIPIVGAFTEATKKVSTLNFQGADNSHNAYVQKIAAIFHEFDAYPEFQEQAAQVILEACDKVNKEYEKNAQVFESKADFIQAFFSEEYKKILKAKK